MKETIQGNPFPEWAINMSSAVSLFFWNNIEPIAVIILILIILTLSLITIGIKRNNEKIQKSGKNCRILIVGCPGVGKTRLWNRIEKQKTNSAIDRIEFDNEGFLKLDLTENYYLVDTPSIELDTEIDLREETIRKFQAYFLKYGHLITNIFITVNFERTDLMKGKVTSVYKYLRKFIDMIGLVITDFEKSENPEQDRIQLLNSFSIYKIPERRILFVSAQQKPEEIKKLFISASNIFSINGLQKQDDIDTRIEFA